LSQLPDFDCLPIPASWFKKFNIPPRNPVGVREFIHSNYAMDMAVKPKDLPPLIIDEPQQNGKLVQFVPVEEIPVEVVSRPFEIPEGKSFPAILPSLTEHGLDELSRRRADTLLEKEPSSSASTQDEKDGTQDQ
jgi:hypothetical protein